MKLSTFLSLFITGTTIVSSYGAESTPNYEVDDNGCIQYAEGSTDGLCRASPHFDGNIYKYTFNCTKGAKFACCDNSYYYESNGKLYY